MKKFNIEFRPDTLQLAYQLMSNMSIIPEVLKFSDGSIRVSFPSISKGIINHRYAIISAFIESMDDLMIVAQCVDIIKRENPNSTVSLLVYGTAYTRYDRVMFENKLDSFGAKVFANFINALNLSHVTFLDAHSEVILDLVNNSVNIDQSVLMDSVVDTLRMGIVCPDKGARKKSKNACVWADKDRNPETGKINGIKIQSVNPHEIEKFNEFIVVDDICEGGGTFLGLADAFKNYKGLEDKVLNLYVTHGIFSNNAIEKLLEKYSKIYVYNMKKSVYYELTRQEQERVIVKILLEG